MIKRDVLIDLLKELEPDHEIDCHINVDQEGVCIYREFTIKFNTGKPLKLGKLVDKCYEVTYY